MGRKVMLGATLKRQMENKEPIIEIIGEDTEMPYLWIGNDGPGKECFGTIEVRALLKFLKAEMK